MCPFVWTTTEASSASNTGQGLKRILISTEGDIMKSTSRHKISWSKIGGNVSSPELRLDKEWRSWTSYICF